MIVTPYDYGIDLLASDLERSPGLHASTIFGDLFESLDPKRYVHEEPPNPMSLAMGTAWEKHLEWLLIRNGVNAVRPGEYLSPPLGERQIRVAYSPDLILFNGVVRCGEIKWSSRGAKDLPTSTTNNLPPKYSKYECQLKLYIYWLRQEFGCEVQGWLSMALMHEPWNPQFRCYNVDYTDRELFENFEMVFNHAVHTGML